MREKDRDREEIFRTMPVMRAILTLAVPTVISQLVTVVYNMADTFFIGRTGIPDQVAAANLCMPPFILLTGIANLFGIGGASLMARSLGMGDRERAAQAASFAIWTSAAVAAAYGVLVLAAGPLILPVIGANAGTYGLCRSYLFWTVTLGGVPTVWNAVLAHLVRAEGRAAQASLGMTMGAVLNMALDPLLISALGLQIRGAAIATLVSNLAAAGYFIVLILRGRETTVIRMHPRAFRAGGGVAGEVLLVGFPGFMMCLMSTLSNAALNRLVSAYRNEAVAGIGIAKKIDMLSFGIANGISQGVLPLVAYNYAAGSGERLRRVIRETLALAVSVAAMSTALLFTCAQPLVRAFIDDAVTVEYGSYFQRVICLTGPCIAVTLTVIMILQAAGEKRRPAVLSLLRKGGLDIPLMLLMNAAAGVRGIVWATPLADIGAMLAALLMYFSFRKQIGGKVYGI